MAELSHRLTATFFLPTVQSLNQALQQSYAGLRDQDEHDDHVDVQHERRADVLEQPISWQSLVDNRGIANHERKVKNNGGNHSDRSR